MFPYVILALSCALLLPHTSFASSPFDSPPRAMLPIDEGTPTKADDSDDELMEELAKEMAQAKATPRPGKLSFDTDIPTQPQTSSLERKIILLRGGGRASAIVKKCQTDTTEERRPGQKAFRDDEELSASDSRRCTLTHPAAFLQAPTPNAQAAYQTPTSDGATTPRTPFVRPTSRTDAPEKPF